ncbi:MAG: hypothetical protein NT151_03235 [Acidobacteria bacterium]|nr:hypothetical protein [Acidobacteriota bacterium]
MRRSWCGRFARLAGLALAAGVCLAPALVAQSAARAPAQSPQSPSRESLLAQAVKAESEFRFDLATDRLYALLIEQPGTPDALTARLRLARLLALTGDLQPAILECQLLRDEVGPENPLRQQAVEMATTLGRRLRAAASPSAVYFPTFEPWPSRGIQNIDEPRTIIFEGEGKFVLLDEGAGRVYRVGQDTGAQAAAPQEPTAATVLPDGNILVFGNTGLATVPASRPVQLTGTQGGKARPFRKVRSMAALSNGDLLVIDRDYDGLIRCQYPAGSCAPAGAVGKQRVVKVGASDWSYLLDERGQALRILDANQRQIAAFGPMIGTVKLERVEDIAVDTVHGLYLLDRDLKRVSVINLRATPDGKISAVVVGSFLIPQEGERGLKNPWAIGAAPGGSLVLAGKGAARIMRLR